MGLWRGEEGLFSCCFCGACFLLFPLMEVYYYCSPRWSHVGEILFHLHFHNFQHPVVHLLWCCWFRYHEVEEDGVIGIRPRPVVWFAGYVGFDWGYLQGNRLLIILQIS
ncbi:hypothetical protein A2U01_0048457 [Trifolium medium]|uniref:Uncharacterized protein n=1 Tax=Trifolium medium TaxID=97028 RepID=A0A392QTD5_9FABA|nr:hypothetical protein [Trifolium medium]